MSSASPAELNAAAVIQLIGSGAYPQEIVLTFARGFLPLSQEDVVAVLAYLASAEDPEVATAARTSLQEIPSKNILAFAEHEGSNPEHLHLLSRATNDPIILQTLTRNRAFSDEYVIELARRADPAVQEVIVINQTRIIRAPEIIDALLENPQVTPDIRRRVLEVREEFFEKAARLAELREFEDPELADVPFDAIADLLEAAEKEPQPPTPPIQLTPTEQASGHEQNLYARLQNMNVAQKVMLAFRGDKAARTLLVRERNKLVCSAAIRNPRMTESEVELIAGSKNVEEEVLRLIGMKRDWMAKYNIMIALARNPRAPLGVVLPLINRLTLRDLKSLKDDKGVPDVVRSNARKLFEIRSKKS